MKALVEQLDSLAVAYDKAAEVLVSHPCDRTDCESRVFEVFHGFFDDGLIPREAEPEGWGLFAKNIVVLVESANWGKRIELEQRIGIVTDTVLTELLEIGPARFPLSISLFQFVLGLLVQSRVIATDFRRAGYFPPISENLEVIFPRTRQIRQRCKLEEESPPVDEVNLE